MNARIGPAVVAFTAIIFAGCSGTPESNLTPISPSLTSSRLSQPARGRYLRAPLSTETVLYRFNTGLPSDGANPFAGLTNLNGTLYGTTLYGGGTGCGGDGCGTIFSITTSGTYRQLYSFAGGSDGAQPYAGLTFTNMKGTLYGTTEAGGGTACYFLGCGTIFSITTDGTYRQLYTFKGGDDGMGPTGSLVNLNGTLYGTTPVGGKVTRECGDGCGMVFSVTTAGAYRPIYHFRGGSDGRYSIAGLTKLNGTLYGTTAYGGGTGCHPGFECGTVFSVTPSGAETVLHVFKGGQDGYNPTAGLTNANGTLYGTTPYGGNGTTGGGNRQACSGFGCGTIFKITPAGAETVLYSFAGTSNGWSPQAALTKIGKTLYGSTQNGGNTEGPQDPCSAGCGTLFSITTSGRYRPLYRFDGNSAGDGQSPLGALTNVNGTLYGTTYYGGNSACDSTPKGCGTLFSLSP